MRVASLEAFRLTLPLVHAFETSSHRKSHLEHILVRVVDDGGAVGWGEIASPSDPYYNADTIDTCWLVLNKYLAPALLGAAWEHPEQAADLWARVRGHHIAKAGVDIACWDLWTRATGQSLSHALGGTREQVAAGVSLGIEASLEDLLLQVRRHVADGYSRVKLKIAPGWDLEPVSAVRQAFPDLQLQVDANGAYTETESDLRTLAGLDDFALLLLEQPFRSGALAAHARLQRRITTPVCLDESIDDLDDLDTALAFGECRVVNIKVSRMGGLTHAKAAHDLAVKNDVTVWCGGMHEFGVGRAANVALASLPGFTLPGDISGSDKYFSTDIVTPAIRAHDGLVTVPHQNPGLGFEVDEGAVRGRSTISFRCHARP